MSEHKINSQPANNSHLQKGAWVAIRTCMDVQSHDRALVISDSATLPIGQALADEAMATGAETMLLLLDSFSERPIANMPDAFTEAIVAFRPTVSFYAANTLPGEYPFRTTLTDLLRTQFHTRHAHMPGITTAVMEQGMATDYAQISALTHRVTELARTAKEIRVTNPKGTDIRAGFNHDLHWYACHGLYHLAGDRGNLPEGETFTSPAWVEGIVVADVLGDYFSEKYGVLEDPVTIEIRDGRAVNISSKDTNLAAELTAYLDSVENGRRVGEFAIGTNIGLQDPVGNLLQDEKIPGVHIAFGSPLPTYSGASWQSDVHVDVIPLFCTIEIDGRRIMTDGEFSPDILRDL